MQGIIECVVTFNLMWVYPIKTWTLDKDWTGDKDPQAHPGISILGLGGENMVQPVPGDTGQSGFIMENKYMGL